MFIKRTKGGSKNKPIYYLQLAYSYRDQQGRPRHKILCTLGREDEILNSTLPETLARRFAKLKDNLIIVDKGEEFIEGTKLLGGVIVLERVWKKLGIEKILEEVKEEYKIQFDLNRGHLSRKLCMKKLETLFFKEIMVFKTTLST